MTLSPSSVTVATSSTNSGPANSKLAPSITSLDNELPADDTSRAGCLQRRQPAQGPGFPGHQDTRVVRRGYVLDPAEGVRLPIKSGMATRTTELAIIGPASPTPSSGSERQPRNEFFTGQIRGRNMKSIHFVLRVHYSTSSLSHQPYRSASERIQLDARSVACSSDHL